ncbi:hypothetical protein VP01_865g4 [Puccinia sorghi]|uniref:Uncharacterized protein n=1 Tax=Puccinia sorghi TaxID=27349 RepID=A0A0L6U8S4_9BASI|nr:hypothetical protein VP01_865g4 [Puccinia sorghi]
MKRPGEHPQPWWEDPNQLTIPQLCQPLIAFGIGIDQGERRTKLFQRYVRLAQTESPESVERWTGQDSLGGPLPAAEQLVVPQIKIFLALHAIDYPPHASRGHLVQLYQSLHQAPPAPRVAVRVLIPSGPKKPKPNPRTSSKASPPEPPPRSKPPRRETLPCYFGKSKPIKSTTRQETFFSPYDRSARRDVLQLPIPKISIVSPELVVSAIPVLQRRFFATIFEAEGSPRTAFPIPNIAVIGGAESEFDQHQE